MAIRTLDNLCHALESDLRWRREEMGVIRRHLKSTARSREQDTFVRAGVALLYAHWEGFVKGGAEAYLQFVAFQVKSCRLTYADLEMPFLGLALDKQLSHDPHEKMWGIYRDTAAFVHAHLSDRAAIPTQGIIGTRSNLKYEVLKQVLDTLGLDPEPYELKQKLIDYSLVGARNSIAHGQHVYIAKDDFPDLHDEVIGMLHAFSNQLQNAAEQEAYLST